MALSDHLKKTGHGDAVTRAMEAMEEMDRSVLIEALRDPGYRHADIGDALRAEGYPVSDRQVAHHRDKLREGRA